MSLLLYIKRGMVLIIKPSELNIAVSTDCLHLLTDPIRVGYERSVYITDEGQTDVELCAIIYEPPSGRALRPFFIFATTTDGSAGTYVDRPFVRWQCRICIL